MTALILITYAIGCTVVIGTFVIGARSDTAHNTGRDLADRLRAEDEYARAPSDQFPFVPPVLHPTAYADEGQRNHGQ